MEPRFHPATSRSYAVSDPMRVTMQFRTREGMAYELREDGARLTVLITDGDTGGPGWRVEAFPSAAPATGIVRAAATRREALRLIGEVWTSDAPTLGLPDFDWEAVASVLTGVHAIEVA